MHQKWEDLPSLNIFCKTSIKDRSQSIPFVCRSWAHASRHPYFWSSIIAADHAFLTDSHRDSFVDPYDGKRNPLSQCGVARFQRLVRRAGVLTSPDGAANDDAILLVISEHCPNLKHISFHGSHNASENAILDIIHTCRKLEVVDFSDSPYFNPLILGELSTCCLNIRGIRRNGYLEPSFSYALSIGFLT